MFTEKFNNTKFGIIGAGHLGLSLAFALKKKGIKESNIFLSYAGSLSTLNRIKKAGLSDSITDNKTLVKLSDIIFLCVRPQEFDSLRNLHLPADKLLISCMAGVEIPTIKKWSNSTMVRIMPLDPKEGLVGMYPGNQIVREILELLSFRIFILKNEDEFHYFTAAICLPSLLIKTYSENRQDEIFKAVTDLSITYPWFTYIYQSVRKYPSVLKNESDRDNYIQKVATKGGITEAIIDSLEKRETVYQALMAGVQRSRELSKIISIN